MIGECTAWGVPYDPWLSVGQIVGWKLESVFPDRPIQVEYLGQGWGAIWSRHNRTGRLTYRPDVLIVYVGHNEFQSRYPWMRDPDSYYLDEIRSLYCAEIPDGDTAAFGILPTGDGNIRTAESQLASAAAE